MTSTHEQLGPYLELLFVGDPRLCAVMEWWASDNVSGGNYGWFLSAGKHEIWRYIEMD
jgi:hypothetical protein